MKAKASPMKKGKGKGRGRPPNAGEPPQEGDVRLSHPRWRERARGIARGNWFTKWCSRCHALGVKRTLCNMCHEPLPEHHCHCHTHAVPCHARQLFMRMSLMERKGRAPPLARPICGWSCCLSLELMDFMDEVTDAVREAHESCGGSCGALE